MVFRLQLRRFRWLFAVLCLLVLATLLPDAPPLFIVPLSPPSRHLPLLYWQHRRTHPELYQNGSCGTFPDIGDVTMRSAHGVWQHVVVSSSPHAQVQVVSAYWDPRPRHPLVRVLLYSDVTPPPVLFCQLWYYGVSMPDVVTADLAYSWSEKQDPVAGVPEPYVASCRLLKGHAWAPAAACLVELPCGTSTVALSVQGAPLPPDISPLPYESRTQAQRPASVCVCARYTYAGAAGGGAGAGGAGEAARLVEWLALVTRLGVDAVHIYITGYISEHVQSVLRQCSNCVVILHPPPPAPLQPLRSPAGRYNLFATNDCLYAALRGGCEWVLPMLVEEIVLPLIDDTYPQLVARAARGDDDVLVVRGRWFPAAAQPDPGRRNTHMLHHVWRAPNYTYKDWYSASFLRTSTVLTAHPRSMHCVSRSGARACSSRRLPRTYAVAHTYRPDCPLRPRYCLAARSNPVEDSTIMRWSDVAQDVERVLRKLNIPSIHDNL